MCFSSWTKFRWMKKSGRKILYFHYATHQWWCWTAMDQVTLEDLEKDRMEDNLNVSKN